nr:MULTISPECIES: cytochrome c [unclassified Herbaspirillum]
MQWLQLGILKLLTLVGAAPDVDGQPAWPFASRLSGEALLIDRNVVRALLLALALTAVGLTLAVLALVRRSLRWRVTLLSTAIVLFFATPWPERHLLTTAATPTSFHLSPTGFSAASIVHGQQLYAQQCIACHGADGKSDTPLALSLKVAPPNLSSGLLWRLSDGDAFWSIRHGKAGMPAFASQLSPGDTWAVLDYLKANAAGQSITETGAWQRPIAAPRIAVDCASDGPAVRSLDQWRGQRIRLLVAAARGQPQASEDPRFQSVLLDPTKLASTAPTGSMGSIGCRNTDRVSLQALSIITGLAANDLAGAELLVDKDGWLRARKRRGEAAWSDADMLCQSAQAASSKQAQQLAGIDALIATMDADRVHYVQGTFVH